MENITTAKVSILGAVGVIGSIIANALGGWDMALRVTLIEQLLLIFD